MKTNFSEGLLELIDNKGMDYKDKFLTVIAEFEAVLGNDEEALEELRDNIERIISHDITNNKLYFSKIFLDGKITPEKRGMFTDVFSNMLMYSYTDMESSFPYLIAATNVTADILTEVDICASQMLLDSFYLKSSPHIILIQSSIPCENSAKFCLMAIK